MSPAGRTAVADDFFLIAHDDRSGRPRLHPRALGVGLAAALLGELALEGRVEVRAGRLWVLYGRPVADALGTAVLARLQKEGGPREAPLWLAFLAQGSADAVGRRLAQRGQVAPTTLRRGLSRVTRYVPTSLNDAAWPAARLRMLLSRGEPMSTADVLLSGLVQAAGLIEQVLWGPPPGSHDHLSRLLAELPPQERELIAQTEAAVGNAVLAARA